jgi:hypothetical protein
VAIVFYLLRFALSALLLGGVGFVCGYKKIDVLVHDPTKLAWFVGRLDVFHDLFYALLIVLLLLPITWWAARKSPRRPWWIAAPPLLGLAALTVLLGVAPLLLAMVDYRKPPLPVGYRIAAWYLLFNLLAVFFYEVAEKARAWISRGVALAVGVADLLAPLLVWRVYRQRRGGAPAAMVILPWSLLALTQLLPWALADIRPPDRPWRLSPAFHLVPGGGTFYQVSVDPRDGAAIVTGGPNWLRKFDPASDRNVASTTISPLAANLQGFGVDLPRRELYYVDVEGGYTYVLDLADLRLKRKIRHLNPYTPRPGRIPCVAAARTQVDPRTGALLAFDFLNYTLLLNRAGDRILADLADACPAISDAVIDPQRRLIHAVSWRKQLIAWDIDARRVVRRLNLPQVPDRLLLDDVRGRLILPLPVPGVLLVVDAGTYRQIARVAALPGVRAPALSQQSKLLYLGCVTPLIEIRSLEDYALIDRVTAPAWTRWLAVDESRNRLWQTPHRGLYGIDLIRLRGDEPLAFFRRWDPFYFLFRWTVAAADQSTALYR